MIILDMVLFFIPAILLTYLAATSKLSNKKVLIYLLVGTLLEIIFEKYLRFDIPIGGPLRLNGFSVLFTLVLFYIIGKRRGVSFNVLGLCSIIAYALSILFVPVVSNKHSDSTGIDGDIYNAVDSFAEYNGETLTPTQFKLITYLKQFYTDTKPYEVVLALVVLCLVLLMIVILLRRNKAQFALAIILTFLTAIVIYMDYSIVNSKFPARLGFKLSWQVLIIIGLVILTLTSTIYGKKADKNNA